jgi:hypothetical protein
MSVGSAMIPLPPGMNPTRAPSPKIPKSGVTVSFVLSRLAFLRHREVCGVDLDKKYKRLWWDLEFLERRRKPKEESTIENSKQKEQTSHNDRPNEPPLVTDLDVHKLEKVSWLI